MATDNIDNIDLNALLFQFTDLLAERLADKVMERINSNGSCAYNDDDLLKTPEAASIIGVSAGTLRNWREKGINIPYIFNKESGHSSTDTKTLHTINPLIKDFCQTNDISFKLFSNSTCKKADHIV